MKDNGGRRLIIDRRKCTNFDHFPERRTRRFRRSDLDRRKGLAEYSRLKVERRAKFREIIFYQGRKEIICYEKG